jgi:DNA-directed RNA polymerase specialized sigma24 family protein
LPGRSSTPEPIGWQADGLKPDDVVVLALRHFVDLELEDIARLLDVPLATAKTRLHSARKRLRARIEEQATDGDTP